MQLAFRTAARRWVSPATIAAILLGVTPCWAVSPTQLDDFQDGTAQGWGVNRPIVPAFVAEDEGPTGLGDDSLLMDTRFLGVPRLLVRNVSQWLGSWTSAGITQIEIGVRNPNAFPLTMRLGIAGPGGVLNGGRGDVYVTAGTVVPADDSWHPLTFGVLASDWVSVGGENTAAALADVTELRVIHNSADSFIGAQVAGGFYLDNIRAVTASTPLAGDYNHNNVVDAADYVVWRDTLNQTGTGLAADGTGPGGVPDGVVNGLDYDFWRARFGNAAPATGSLVAAAMVPEPESALLMLWLFASLCLLVAGKAAAIRRTVSRPIVARGRFSARQSPKR